MLLEIQLVDLQGLQ
ncbi:hypothetical protein D039_0132A, partial [Vibrio parahaemolyticus EKP-028]